MSVTDGELMQAVQRGDGQALAGLVHRYHAPLRGYLLRLTHDEFLTDDLVQETFLRVYTRADTFGPGRSFRPWLYRIATNLFFDWHRRRRDMPAGLAGDGTAAGLATGADPDPGGDGLASVVRSEEQWEVRQALAQLAADHRAILLLRFDRELSIAEIADVLSIPVGTVKSRLFRALRQFKQQLAGAPGRIPEPGAPGRFLEPGATGRVPAGRRGQSRHFQQRQKGGAVHAGTLSAAARPC